MLPISASIECPSGVGRLEAVDARTSARASSSGKSSTHGRLEVADDRDDRRRSAARRARRRSRRPRRAAGPPTVGTEMSVGLPSMRAQRGARGAGADVGELAQRVELDVGVGGHGGRLGPLRRRAGPRTAGSGSVSASQSASRTMSPLDSTAAPETAASSATLGGQRPGDQLALADEARRPTGATARSWPADDHDVGVGARPASASAWPKTSAARRSGMRLVVEDEHRAGRRPSGPGGRRGAWCARRAAAGCRTAGRRPRRAARS